MARRGEDWGCWGHYHGLLFHPEDIAIGGRREGGRGGFLSLISRTAPSALIAGFQRQPEVNREWMGEKHPRREKRRGRSDEAKKAMFIPLRLHQMTAALQFSA